MKKITSLLIVVIATFCSVTTVSAQSYYMYINRYDGSVEKILRSEVKNITFGSETNLDYHISFNQLSNTGKAQATINFGAENYSTVQNNLESAGFCFYPTSEGSTPQTKNNPVDCTSSLQYDNSKTMTTFSGTVNGQIGNTFSVRAYAIIGGVTYYSDTRTYTAEKEEENISVAISKNDGYGTGVVTISVEAVVNRETLPNAAYIEYGTSSGSYTTAYNCTSEALNGEGHFSVNLTLTPGTTYYLRCYCTFPDGSANLYSNEISIIPTITKE